MGTQYQSKGTYRSYTELDKENALKALKKGSVRFVSDQLGIPTNTLQRWKEKPDMVLGSGNTCVLSTSEEGVLVTTIEYMGMCGMPLSRPKLLDIVQSFIKFSGIKTAFRQSRPGKKWIQAFELRHKDRIARRSREGLSKARIEGLTEVNVKDFFESVYQPYYDKCEIKDSPWLLWNLDESAFQASRAHEQVYVGRRQRNAYAREASQTRGSFTVLFCCNAVGQYLAPYTILKGKGLMSNHVKGGYPGAGYGYSDSGWMMDYNFASWFEQAFVPETRVRAAGRQQILLFDGHNSHLSYKTIRIAMDNNIVLIALPPNTSHALQPLDVGVFKSVKGLYSEEVLKWYSESGNKNVDKDSFPYLLKAVWEQLKESWACGGFEKTGLHPLKPDKVTVKIVHDPRDGVPPELTRGPGNGPKSTVRLLVKVIGKALAPVITPRVVAVNNKKAGGNKRVQAAMGEVMTEPEAEARLLRHEEERAAKKRKGPATRSKAGSSGVTIAIKAPGPKAAQIPLNGTLDSFITRTPVVTLADVHQEPLPQVHDDPIQTAPLRPLPGSFLNSSLSQGNRRKSIDDSIYRELSTTEESDLDPDDPASTFGASNLPVWQVVDRKRLKAQSTHVIYHHEESFFPGLVVKRNRDDKTIRVKSMIKCHIKVEPSFWTWPEIERFIDVKIHEIVDTIPPPKLFSNRGSSYHVPLMSKYWK